MTIIMLLAVYALLLPPPAEYVAALLVLGFLWRERRNPLPPNYVAAAKLVTIGTAVFFGGALVSDLVAGVTSSVPPAWGNLFQGEAHLLLKRCIVWIVFYFGIGHAYRRGWRVSQVAKQLFVFLLFYFAYGMVQRYTGIDWVHGFGTKLEANRFAYDVFRVSGVMGHPISLSYNLMVLMFLTLVTLQPYAWNDWQPTRLYWLGNLALLTMLLLISGSRWPIVVIMATLVLVDGKWLWRVKKWLALSAVVAGIAVWLEGSLLGRFTEVTAGNADLYERIPRLLFWRIHWHMFLDHPLAGVGYYFYEGAAANYYTIEGFQNFREKYAAHNIFLQTLADGGLIGFAGLLTLFACLFAVVRRLRAQGKATAPFTYLIVATLIGGLMQNVLRDSTYLYALWFGLAVFLAAAEFREQKLKAEDT